MPHLLRGIRKNRWLITAEMQRWLVPGDSPADVLLDLQTSANRLSVWIVNDEQTELDRVLAAFAAKRDRASNVDFLLFDQTAVLDLGIRLIQSPGETPDQEINANNHFDLIDLSASQLCQLAKLGSSSEQRRCSEIRVKGLLAQGIGNGTLDREQLKPSILRDIDKYRASREAS